MFQSTRRLKHKIGVQKILDRDPQVHNADLTDLEYYNVGTQRTVLQFLKYAGMEGLDKVRHHATSHQRHCADNAPPPYTTQSTHQPTNPPTHHPQEPPVVEGNCRLSRSTSSTPNGALKHVPWADVDKDPLRYHGTISHGDTTKSGGYY